MAKKQSHPRANKSPRAGGAQETPKANSSVKNVTTYSAKHDRAHYTSEKPFNLADDHSQHTIVEVGDTKAAALEAADVNSQQKS